MDSKIAHTDDWVNVFENKTEYEDRFEIPTEADLKQLSIHDTVKISNGFERFFVRVKEIQNTTVIGVIENHLIGKYDYDFNDTVRFDHSNIFTIKKNDLAMDPKKLAGKNARRMIKLLGVDPSQSSKEALAVMSIMRQNT